MNNKTDIDVQYVSPLKKICMTIGELPASYLETMSYYEMLVWFTEFLKNQVIPTVNNNAEAVSELQALYEELRTYVNNYFDNLDVQDEIDHKLDEMVLDGTMESVLRNITITSIKISNLSSLETDTAKFIEAITNYDYINIDEDIEITLTSPISLDHSINLYGEKTLTIHSDLPFLIKVTKDNIGIDVHDLTMITDYTGFLFAGGDTTDGYMNKSLKYFKFNNVDLSGTGQICCFYLTDSESNQIDVDYVEIKNNNVHSFTYDNVANTAYLPGNVDNHQANAIFIVQNVNCNSVVIENNRIRNCEMEFAIIKNRHETNTIKNLIIDNNSMINDDSCWGDNTQYHLYYYFIFGEAEKVTYTNNYVEGLKVKTYTAGGYGSTVGDIYASAKEYVSQNNTTKNTRQFYNNGIIAQEGQGDIYHWLFKNKESKNILIKNNTIIQEKEWIEDLCDADENLNKSQVLGHYDIVIDCAASSEHDYWSVLDNNINVPNLRFEAEQITTEECYNFSGNIINCENIYGYMFYNGDYNSHFSSFICENNEINAKEKNNEIFKITHGQSVSNPVTTSPRVIDVIIKNNTFNVPNFYSNQATINNTTVSQYLKATNFIMENNTFYRNVVFNSISLNDKIISSNNNVIETVHQFNKVTTNTSAAELFTNIFNDNASINYAYQTTALNETNVYGKILKLDNWKILLNCKLYEDSGNILEFNKVILTTYDSESGTFTVNGTTVPSSQSKHFDKSANDMQISYYLNKSSAEAKFTMTIYVTSSTYPDRIEVDVKASTYTS